MGPVEQKMIQVSLDVLREKVARFPTLYFVTQQHTELAKTFVTFRLSDGFTVKVKMKFTLEQATNSHNGSRGIALLFL
jgi:hypothetical protein